MQFLLQGIRDKNSTLKPFIHVHMHTCTNTQEKITDMAVRWLNAAYNNNISVNYIQL